MLKPAGETAALPRAFLRIGPASVARHQLSLALTIDCQRIVCIAPGMSPELLQLQHDSERAGARFNIVTGAHGLAALVTANDDVLLIGDGLLAPIDAATGLLESSHAVLVQPIESGLALGFERIDLNYASAGLMRVPGRLLERLNELPADCDVESALTRIALQAGVAQRQVPADARDGLRWRLVSNEGEAHAAEASWIALHLDGEGPLTPGPALARFAVRSFGPAILHAGSGGNMLAFGAWVGTLLALGLAWFGFTVTALVLWSFSWILRRIASLLLAVEWESLARAPEKWSREPIFGLIHDTALVVILAWNVVPYPDSSIWARGFAPLILVCLLRLAPHLYGAIWSAWLADRSLLGLVLVVLAATGVLSPGLQTVAVLLALSAIFSPSGTFRLTST